MWDGRRARALQRRSWRHGSTSSMWAGWRLMLRRRWHLCHIPPGPGVRLVIRKLAQFRSMKFFVI
jgi:hypothetical protein